MPQLKDMTPRERILIVEYALYFESLSTRGAGYAFPCDSEGNVSALSEAARENYELCRATADQFWPPVVENRSHHYTEPATGKCVCGRTVVLDHDFGHGIDCDCGRIYNLSGWTLAPRSLWEDRYDEESTQPYYAEFGHGSDY